MADPVLPLVVEPTELARHLDDPRVLIVDLCKPATYAQAHIPGAVHLDYARLVAGRKPAVGQLPDDRQLSEALSAIGLTSELHVVAYDDEGGGRAARLLWTLDVIGHPHASLLNGGLHAWTAEQRPLSQMPPTRTPTAYRAARTAKALADREYVRSHLNDPSVVLLDARSADEFQGIKRYAERAGHIPGAVNFDWVNAIDQTRALRLKPADELRRSLAALGVTPDKEVITYCQTHHRSAHSYIMLKSLGFRNVKGYPGSWSEWGNSTDTPVA